MTNGPLEGIRITEFTSAWAGPYTTCLLGFLGAEVIKVESKKRIDHSRFVAFSTSQSFDNPDSSSVFNSLNLNKKSVTLNLAKPRSIEIAKQLVENSQVVVENMRPGVMPRLGLGYDALRQVRPDIVYLSSSACGQSGPDREFIGYAPNFASVGGISHNTGYEDWGPSGFSGFIDIKSATTAAFAIMMALCYHQDTGEGQYIDLASQETVAILNSDALLEFVMNGREKPREGNRDSIMAPHNCYPCLGEDTWLSIAVATDREWLALCSVMGRPELSEDRRFSDSYSRWTNQEELDPIIGNWTKDFAPYEAMEKLQRAGVAAAPSLSSKGLFQDPHLKEREIFQAVEHPVMGEDWVVAPPWRLSETPAGIHRHAPLLGEHNEQVFGGLLGMSEEEMKQLEEEQVIY
ncbi:MAG: CoA transferase [Proteobacteria bacterium]|nr:CoA transferase [Pseudomonadota bacterium]